MQRLEVSGAVRLIYRSLGVKGLICEGLWLAVAEDVYPDKKETFKTLPA
jgi:hypothetical protein